MKNRPLLSVCLMVLCIIAFMVVWGRERFIKELRPSPIERYAAEGDNITICGKIYRQEQKENCRMIYLKENSIYSNSKKFQESKIIIYTNSSPKLHIGNQIKVCGKYHFMKRPEILEILIRNFIIKNRESMGKSDRMIYRLRITNETN